MVWVNVEAVREGELILYQHKHKVFPPALVKVTSKSNYVFRLLNNPIIDSFRLRKWLVYAIQNIYFSPIRLAEREVAAWNIGARVR